MMHATTAAYLAHMVETGLVTGFRISAPEPPHDSLSAALVAVLDGALPGNRVADELRRIHACDLDADDLDAFFAWAPAWGRVLTLVQDPESDPVEQSVRYREVRAALDHWRRTRCA